MRKRRQITILVVGIVLALALGAWVFLPRRVFWVELARYDTTLFGERDPEPVEARPVWDAGWTQVAFTNDVVYMWSVERLAAYHV